MPKQCHVFTYMSCFVKEQRIRETSQENLYHIMPLSCRFTPYQVCPMSQTVINSTDVSCFTCFDRRAKLPIIYFRI